MKPTLQDWARNGWLVEHRTSAQEIRDLLRVADRDLQNSRAQGLDADWRFNIVYSAALQLATAALAAAGYRLGKGAGGHYYAVESLRLTVGAEPSLVEHLQAARRKRNISVYERAGMVGAQEADTLLESATELKRLVTDWLRSEHPDFMAGAD